LLSLPEQVKYIQYKQMLLVTAQILAAIAYAVYLFPVLEGPGILCRWKRDFPHPSRPPFWDPPIALYNGKRTSFPGSKGAGAWCWLPTPTSAEVKERVELFLYPHPGFHCLFWTEIYLYFCSRKRFILWTKFAVTLFL